MKKINAVIVGYGLGGEFFHAPVIQSVDEFEIYGFLERKTERSIVKYPNAKIFRTIEEVCNDKNVDIVIVTTPNETHHEIALKAIEASKHVVVDKPFTITSNQASELTAAAIRKGIVLSVYHNKRYSGDFLTVQHLLEMHSLGKIINYKSFYDRYRPELKGSWKETSVPGAGLLYDLGSHLIDQVLVLFGKPKSLEAVVKVERSLAKADDFFHIIFHYPSHTAEVGASMLTKDPRPVFDIHGQKARYIKHSGDPQETALREGKIPAFVSDWGKESSEQWGNIELGIGSHKYESLPGNFCVFYKQIADKILGKQTNYITPFEAAEVIKTIELCQQSSNLGGKLIEL